MNVRGLLLVLESKDAGCHYAYHLYDELAKIPNVLETYPLIGGTDGSVWIEAPDLASLTETVRAVQAMAGVRHTELLLASPDTP